MTRVRIKTCGITNKEDAKMAVNSGSDALGFVFYANSSRYITPRKAHDIIATLPPFVDTVALFVNAQASEVREILNITGINWAQFHGDESQSYCDEFAGAYIKAVRVRNEQDITNACKTYTSASAILLDAYVDKEYGGTGQTFDWRLIPEKISMPIIVAGGLKCDNIDSLLQYVCPYAVDVSGGVEKTPGKKDINLLQNFNKRVAKYH